MKPPDESMNIHTGRVSHKIRNDAVFRPGSNIFHMCQIQTRHKSTECLKKSFLALKTKDRIYVRCSARLYRRRSVVSLTVTSEPSWR